MYAIAIQQGIAQKSLRPRAGTGCSLVGSARGGVRPASGSADLVGARRVPGVPSERLIITQVVKCSVVTADVAAPVVGSVGDQFRRAYPDALRCAEGSWDDYRHLLG